MARVALVNLASLPMPGNDPIFPIGLRCVQDALERAGHETQLFDFVENSKDFEDLTWATESWDVIGFSIRNIDPIDLAHDGFVDHYERFVDRVRQTVTSDPLLVGGGPGYSLFGQALLTRLKLDVGVVGPGEKCMLDIVANPDKHRAMGRNLIGERFVGFTTNELAHPKPLLTAYAKAPKAMIGIETRRKTCYQDCVYCPYAYISGDNSGDYKPLELIAAELKAIYAAGIRRVFFTDAIFNGELRFAKQVVQLITELNLPGLTWSAYFTPKPFDDEFAQMLPASNVEQIVVSPDSLDSRMMGVLGKRFDTRHVTRFLERCRRHDLTLRVIIVLGGPTEDRESVRASAEYANTYLKDDELILHVGYRVLPSTGLARQLAIPDEELLNPVYYPVDQKLFSWILEDFDGRFFSTGHLLTMMAWRHSVKKMARVPLPEENVRKETAQLPYLALSRQTPK